MIELVSPSLKILLHKIRPAIETAVGAFVWVGAVGGSARLIARAHRSQPIANGVAEIIIGRGGRGGRRGRLADLSAEMRAEIGVPGPDAFSDDEPVDGLRDGASDDDNADEGEEGGDEDDPDVARVLVDIIEEEEREGLLVDDDEEGDFDDGADKLKLTNTLPHCLGGVAGPPTPRWLAGSMGEANTRSRWRLQSVGSESGAGCSLM